MASPVVQLFVNPRPGRRAQRRVVALVDGFRQHGAEVRITASARERLEIDPRCDHVCVVGGDGTLRHVVAAMHRAARAVPISAYPGGSVNLLARERGFARSPDAFVARVLGSGPGAEHHTGLVAGMPLLTCASVGPDSYAVAALSPALKRRIGRAAYLVAFLKILLRWPRAAMTVRCDNERFACEAIYVAKGRYYAGPWTFAPDARLTEPILHVVALTRASRAHFLRFAWRLWRGLPLDHIANVRRFRCTSLSIAGNGHVPLQADGDIVARLPTTITLRPDPTRFA